MSPVSTNPRSVDTLDPIDVSCPLPEPSKVKKFKHFRSTFMITILLCLWAMLVGAEVGGRSASRAPKGSSYDTAVRDETELAAALASVCTRSLESGRPLLMEFSAPWCSDCLVLHRMKQEEALAAELAQWPHIVINVGEFEEHPELLEAFDVRSIARWVVLRPASCKAPISQWRRITQRTLEPDSGAERAVSAGDLAEWLESLRTR